MSAPPLPLPPPKERKQKQTPGILSAITFGCCTGLTGSEHTCHQPLIIVSADTSTRRNKKKNKLNFGNSSLHLPVRMIGVGHRRTACLDIVCCFMYPAKTSTGWRLIRETEILLPHFHDLSQHYIYIGVHPRTSELLKPRVC